MRKKKKTINLVKSLFAKGIDAVISDRCPAHIPPVGLLQYQVNLSKAFHTVSHSHLQEKLRCYGLDKCVSAVHGELADRPHPEGGGEQLLFKLGTYHKCSATGIDIEPKVAQCLRK